MITDKKEEKIEELLDEKFLNKLLEIAKIYGWSGDYAEIGQFVENIHRIQGIKLTEEELEPYDYEE